MSKFSEMSDFEINKLVAEAQGLRVDEINNDSCIGMNSKYHEQYPDTVWAHPFSKHTGEQTDSSGQLCYTHSWADMGPIIASHEISIVARSDSTWIARKEWSAKQSTNPLRAAAIIYLETMES